MNQIVDINKLLDDLQYSISDTTFLLFFFERSTLHSGACQSEKANKQSWSLEVFPSAETDSSIVFPSFTEGEEKETPRCLSPSVTKQRSSFPVPLNEGLIDHSSSSATPDENNYVTTFPSKLENSSSVEFKPLSQLTSFPETSAHVPALSNPHSLVQSQRIEQFCEPSMNIACTKIAKLSLSQSSDSTSEVSAKEWTHHATLVLPAHLGSPSMEPETCSPMEIFSVPPAVKILAPSSSSLPADSPLSDVGGEVSTESEQRTISTHHNQETAARLLPSPDMVNSAKDISSFSPRPESTQEDFYSLAAESSSFSSSSVSSFTPPNNSRAENFTSAAQSADSDEATLTGVPPPAVFNTAAAPVIISKGAALSSSDIAVYQTPPNYLSSSDFSMDYPCVQSLKSPNFSTAKTHDQSEETTSLGSPRITDFDDSSALLPGPAPDVLRKVGGAIGMDFAYEPQICVPSAVATVTSTDGRPLSEDDLTGTNNDTNEVPLPSLPFIAKDEEGVEKPVQEETLFPIEFPASEHKGDEVNITEGEMISEAEALAAEQSTAPMTDTADWPVSLPPGEIGTREPTWVADDAYSNCMSCGAKFTVWRRRHHCRTCGRLLCSQCTPARLRLAFATTASAESGETAASETTTTEGGDSAAAATTAPQLRSPAQPHGRPNPSLEQRLMKLISGQAGRLHRVCTDCFEVLSVHPDSNPGEPAENTPERTQIHHRASAAGDSSVGTLNENETPLPNRRTFSPQDAIDALTDNCLIPSPVADESGHLEFRWPPLVVQSENNLELQPNPSAEQLISLLGSSAAAPEVTDKLSGVTFAVTRNLLVHVYLTTITCCLAQDAWCFISAGLQAVGHNEVLLLIRRRPNELLPPVDALWQYFALYDMTLNRGCASRTQPCDISSPRLRNGICLLEPLSSYTATTLPQPTAWFQETTGQDGESSLALGWAGFLYFHPGSQCLFNLRLPEPPFLCGVLVHAWEAAWARHLPLRLLLCLGKLSNSSATNSLSPSLLSDRDRSSVFPQATPESILSVFFPDLAGQSEADVSTDMPFIHVPRLEIVLRGKEEEDSLQLQLTFNSMSSHLAKSLFTKRLRNCLLLGLSGDFVQSADYHLVCSYSSEENGFQSEILSCSRQDQATRTMPTMGASFVVFEGGAERLSLSIVEDGCVARLTAEQFALLTSALRSRSPLSLNTVSAPNTTATPIISVVWLDEEVDTNILPSPFSTRFSWIDGRPIPARLTFCIPPEQQLRHWLMTTHQSPLRTASPNSQVHMTVTKPLVAWVRLHKLGEPTVFAVDNQSGESLDLSAVINAIVSAFIVALAPYVQKLFAADVTRFALRIRLQPPMVFSFLIGSPALWSSGRTVTAADVIFCSDSSQGGGGGRWWWRRVLCPPAVETPSAELLLPQPSQLQPLLEDSGYINDVDSALIPMLDGLTRNITCRRLVGQAVADTVPDDNDSQPPPALEFEFDFTLHG